MKILFLTNLSDRINGFHDVRKVTEESVSGLGLNYPLNLLRELSHYADVHVYSPPLEGYVSTASMPNINQVQFIPQNIAVPQTVDAERLMEGKGFDIVLLYAESIFSYTRNFERIRQKKVLWFLSSPQQILLPQYKERVGNIDLVLKVVDKANITEYSKEFERLGLKTEWLPLSVDGNRFRNLGLPKIADFCLLGNLNPVVYPLRLKATNFLVAQKKYRLFLVPAYGEDYVRTINAARVLLTCSGVHKFPVMKYYEAMACGTLLLADKPLDAEELGFEADVNYVELDATRLGESIEHATHVSDAVAKAGERFVRDRHTDSVRAKELYGMLESI